ncbi:MAG: hypothetical protein QOH48_1258 [Actinomycetota bacterium]|jgi:hypothetical protein|nr:hypothetical protein [Actinomycetota bacterium]
MRLGVTSYGVLAPVPAKPLERPKGTRSNAESAERTSLRPEDLVTETAGPARELASRRAVTHRLFCGLVHFLGCQENDRL